MMMISIEFSEHALKRADRIAECITTIGIGERYVAKAPDARHPYTERWLTNSGLVLVYSTSTHKLVTAYMADIDQAYAICRAAHVSLTENFARLIKRNVKRYAYLLRME